MPSGRHLAYVAIYAKKQNSIAVTLKTWQSRWFVFLVSQHNLTTETPKATRIAANSIWQQ